MYGTGEGMRASCLAYALTLMKRGDFGDLPPHGDLPATGLVSVSYVVDAALEDGDEGDGDGVEGEDDVLDRHRVLAALVDLGKELANSLLRPAQAAST